MKKMTGKTICGLAMAAFCVAGAAGVLAQAPGIAPDTAPGMGPHRPPMERAMGPGGEGGEHGRWWDEGRMAETLKLTDAQRKAMDDIYQQHRLKLVDLHATLQKEELTMEPLIRADQPDEAKILAQIDKVAQARAELEKANARMLFEIRRQLTAEQWKTLQAERNSRHEHPGMNGEGRGQWGGQDRGMGHGQGRGMGQHGSGSQGAPSEQAPPPPPSAGPGGAEE